MLPNRDINYSIKATSHIIRKVNPMSLSEHERTQFNRLTEVFVADDPGAAKRLARKASTSMTHFVPEDLWMVAVGAFLLGVIGVITGFMTGNFLQSFLCVPLGCAGYLLWARYPVKQLFRRR